MNKRELGERGEQIALEYLLSRGYVLLARNVYIGHNEIDIIMRDGETIVFVEVKARSSTSCGLAREAVGAKKQSRLIEAAYGYLQGCEPDTSARFDVMEVDLKYNTTSHIINAFMDRPRLVEY